LDIFLWIFLCGLIYAILSSFKKGFIKHSILKEDIKEIKNIYKKAFIESIISSIGLLISVIIVYACTKTALPNLFAFVFGAFTCFYLVKIILFKILQKPTSK
jgi:hypothetical protein